MLAPINYMLENKSPMDSFFGGMQSVQGIQQNNNTLRQQELVNEQQAAAQARKAQMEADLDQLDTTSIEAMRAFNAKYPDMAKGVQQAYDALDAKQKQNTLLNHSRIASLVKNGRPDAAIQMLEAQTEAYQNAGDEQGAQEAKSMADLIRMSPEAAQATLTWGLSIMSPKDVSDNLKAFTDATGKTRKEVDAGDAIYSYDIDPLTGEIGGAEWVVDKSATPDNVLDNETSRINTTQTNMVSEGNNIRTNQTSENNNIRTNTVSENNNIRTNQTSRLNSKDANDIKKYGIDVNRENAANILEYRRQQDEIKSKQAKLQTFGGQVYVTYPDGTAAPAKDKQGNNIYDNKPNSTSKKATAEFQADIDRNNQLIGTLTKAKNLSKKGIYEGYGAEGRANAVGSVPFLKGTETSKRTQEFINIVQNNALSSMKAIFGGNPTEGERAILMKLQASAQYPADVREAILDEAIAAAQARIASTKGQMDIVNGVQSQQAGGGGNNNDIKRSSLFN